MNTSFSLDISRFLCDREHKYIDFNELNDKSIEQLLDFFTTDRILDCIEELNRIQIKDSFLTSEIPVFGSLDISINRVPELLVFAENGLSFKELGKKLLNTDNEINSQKYGEVSAKTAEIVNLVKITNDHPKKALISQFGHHLLAYGAEDKKNLIKAIMLQNAFIQSLVFHAVYSKEWSYYNWVNSLSETSRMRRRQNVRRLLRFILSDTGLQECENSIDWSIK